MPMRDLRARFAGGGLELMVGFAAGAAANTAITITGIKPGDQLVAVLELQPPTAASGNAIVANHTSATTITGPNTIRISAGTAGNQVLVIWWSV